MENNDKTLLGREVVMVSLSEDAAYLLYGIFSCSRSASQQSL